MTQNQGMSVKGGCPDGVFWLMCLGDLVHHVSSRLWRMLSCDDAGR